MKTIFIFLLLVSLPVKADSISSCSCYVTCNVGGNWGYGIGNGWKSRWEKLKSIELSSTECFKRATEQAEGACKEKGGTSYSPKCSATQSAVDLINSSLCVKK